MEKLSFEEIENMVNEMIELGMTTLFSDEMKQKHGWDRQAYERICAESLIFEELEHEEGVSYH